MENDVVRTRMLQNIHDLQDGYRQATKQVEQFAGQEDLWAKMWKLLSDYRIGDDPHRAVYLIARATALMEPMHAAYSAISEYKAAQAKIEAHDRRRDIANG